MPLFPPARVVLGPAEGSLAEAPVPLLLHAVFVERRTCALAFRRNALEKRILFEEGVPVACESNLLHETLGRFLVSEGRLTEPQYQEALAESVASGRRMGELLLQKGWIAPFDLFRVLQRNLALRILDAFSWTDGAWRIQPNDGEVDTPLKMNPAQLVLTGCTTSAPFDLVASGLAFVDEQRFALVPDPPHQLSMLKLSTKDSRLLSVLKGRPDFPELQERTRLTVEEAMRRLYAFALLGFVAFAEEVEAMEAAAPAGTGAGPEAAAPMGTGAGTAAAHPAGTGAGSAAGAPASGPAPEVARAEALRDEIMRRFLEHRRLDPFDLLGVPEDVGTGPLKQAFLDWSERFAPWSIHAAGLSELAEKAEHLFLAGARAWAELNDPGRRAEALKRRRNAEEARSRPRRTDFRIRTDLLDGDTQFATAQSLLEAGRLRPALEHFQYALDIEPRRALFKAWLGWARFLVDPERAWRLALQELGAAQHEDPSCPDAFLFQGRILHARGELEGAETALRRAVKLAPDSDDALEALRELARAKRGG